MPIYEYKCNACKRKVTIFVQGFQSKSTPTCSSCQSTDLTRLFSSFRIGKTYQDFYQDILTDRSLVQGMMANDPKALAKWSRKMDAAAGGEMGPEHEDMMQRLEGGETFENLVTEAQKEALGPDGGDAPASPAPGA